MTFIPVPQCAEAVLLGDNSGKEIVNVLNFHFGAAYAASDIQALAIAVDGVVSVQYPPLISPNCQYLGVKAKGLANINDFEYNAVGSPVSGTASGTPLPANTTICIKLATALTGRSARGRFYAWPTSTGKLAGTPDTFLNSYATDLINMINDIGTAAAAAGWAMSVVSRFTLGAARSSGVAFPITNAIARNTTVDSQRGRLPKAH